MRQYLLQMAELGPFESVEWDGLRITAALSNGPSSAAGTAESGT